MDMDQKMDLPFQAIALHMVRQIVAHLDINQLSVHWCSVHWWLSEFSQPETDKV